MSYWLIRTGAPSVQVSVQSNEIIVKSRRRAAIKPRDTLVLLDWKRLERAFTYSAMVEEIEASVDGDVRVTRIIVDTWTPLEPEVELDMFRYSLLMVRNLERPNLHFRQGYRRLPQADFTTIKAGEPFIARTIYFELLTALPDVLQRAYQAEVLRSTLPLPERESYLERATRVADFIRSRVLAAGRLVIQLDDQIRGAEFLADDGTALTHELVDEDDLGVPTVRSDNIATQASAFRSLVSEWAKGLDGDNGTAHETDVLDQIAEEMKDSNRRALEAKFEIEFQRQQ